MYVRSECAGYIKFYVLYIPCITGSKRPPNTLTPVTLFVNPNHATPRHAAPGDSQTLNMEFAFARFLDRGEHEPFDLDISGGARLSNKIFKCH